MSKDLPTLQRMQALIAGWDRDSDPRSIFLRCYLLMTRNMLAAIDAGEFNDPAWVRVFLHRFADYYFDALDEYDRKGELTPPVWRTVHDATRNEDTFVLQNLLLGINAHINYDLVLTLVDLMDHEWASLGPVDREKRYQDHYHVNAIIGRTIDIVQDQVVEVLAPGMDLIDKLMGPIDEWLISELISKWRDEVWIYAVNLIETVDQQQRQQQLSEIERTTLNRARTILLENSIADLTKFL